MPTQGWDNAAFAASAEDAARLMGVDEFGGLLDAVDLDTLGPQTIIELQEECRNLALERADRAVGAMLVWLLAQTNLNSVAVQAFRDREPDRYVNKGNKEVDVELPCGERVPVKATYLLHQPKRICGRAKNHGNRGEEGRGIYPALEVLGIDSMRRLSPFAEETILETGATCDAFRTGWEMAQKMGVRGSWSAYHKRFTKMATQLEEDKSEWLEAGMGAPLYDPANWIGRRVVIAADGGRTRLREEYGGAPCSSGYHRFNAEWREPKLFTIYAIDEEGEIDKEVAPIIDGTFGDADAFFGVLRQTLDAVGITRAKEVSFLGDGAPWIWLRARPMLIDLGVSSKAITETVDWYHATQALVRLGDKVGWGEVAAIKWRKKTTKHLEAGDVEKVISLLEKLAKKRGVEEAETTRDYFKRNAERMRYAARREANLPEGSGAIESGIRRVVNLRMKGNAKYWNEENAEAMLTVRGALKTERFERLIKWSRDQRGSFWGRVEQGLLRENGTNYARRAA
jgi:hypothetical protein